MIALVLAVAMMLDPSVQKVSIKAAPPAAEAAPTVSSGPILTSVAVTLECTARANGHVEDCHVLGETHPGLGFGEAAVALMRGEVVEPGVREVQFARTIQFMP